MYVKIEDDGDGEREVEGLAMTYGVVGDDHYRGDELEFPNYSFKINFYCDEDYEDPYVGPLELVEETLGTDENGDEIRIGAHWETYMVGLLACPY